MSENDDRTAPDDALAALNRGTGDERREKMRRGGRDAPAEFGGTSHAALEQSGDTR